jgi:cytochrome bd ubiquinol oxidase subunit I
MDAVLLARIQFGFTISFHIVFPGFTIGLASYLAVLEGLWMKTGRRVYLHLYHFWSQVFAVAFGMGVVSGLIMAYQFGTNWSEFSRFAGGITGPLLAYEVLTAFFLEAGFLGVMLFGMKRVGPALHFVSTLAVAVGTLVSATWILASNSWMHTPQGYQIIDGRVVPVDWIAVIVNPSFPYRLTHMVLAAFIATALVVGGSAAWHLVRGRSHEPVRVMLSMALWMLFVVAPLQALVGDAHGLNTLEHQPAKLAAIEGHWENHSGEGVPLILFGWPDMQAETTHWKIEIPHGASLLLTHSWDGKIPALKDFAPIDRPNSTIVFWTFRVMVGLGSLIILFALLGLWLRRGGRLYRSRPFLRFAILMSPSGLIALLAGWMTTEIGRQPWVVYGLMRTADAVSPVGALQLGISLSLFVVVYLLVFGAGTFFLLHLIAKGPQVDEGVLPVDGGPGQIRNPARPMSAAPDAVPAFAGAAHPMRR